MPHGTPRVRPSADRRRSPLRVLLVSLALMAFAPLSYADWLVTKDGERIETRGDWKVEGQRVLFHLPNGTFSALRLEQVDLEQSRVASSDQPQPPASEVERTPVLVLTDEDVARALPQVQEAGVTGQGTAEGQDGDGDAAGEEISDSEATALATARRPDLEVSSWRAETAENGVRFVGTVENGSPDFAALLTVEVALYDETGALIDTQPARLAKRSLAPGASTTFDLTFDGVYSYGDAVFTPDGRTLRARPPASAANATASPDDGVAPAPELAPDPADQPGAEPPPRR